MSRERASESLNGSTPGNFFNLGMDDLKGRKTPQIAFLNDPKCRETPQIFIGFI
jgi:hypothetical protein